MPFTEEEYALLRGGRDVIAKWNTLRKSKQRKGEQPELIGADLSWLSLSLANLSGANLSGANLEGANLERANLSGANLEGANLEVACLDGADLSGAKLHGAKLRGAILRGAYLSRADLGEANLTAAFLDDSYLSEVNLFRARLPWAKLPRVKLFRANLCEADLHEANLCEADLTGAYLSGADLSKAALNRSKLHEANLVEANLRGANLVEANLRGANLGGASLSGANLSGADLSKVNLSGADLESVSFRGATLTSSILDRALLISVDLTDATVEDADITGVVIHELRGLPRPPCRIRRQEPKGEEIVLTGEEVANIFVLSAVVEVYLTRALSEVEAGALQFHLGEVHANGEACDVYLVGHRCEGEGSVLRFQGPTYEAVYIVLPDLLAPFRTTVAIDWKATLDSIPKADRPDALMTLVRTEARLVKGRWAIAERLAQSFEGFANARVVRLTEGRNKGVSITVATDDTMIEKVAWALLPVTARNAATVIQNATFKEGSHMGDKYEMKGTFTGTAVGPGASVTAHDITANVLKQAEASADREWAGVVKRALDALSAAKLTEGDHADAAKKVEEIQTEAGQTNSDPSRPTRIRRWLDYLSSLCKPAADLLAGAKVVMAALGVRVD